MLVYHEEDDSFNVGVGLSRSERFVYIETGTFLTVLPLLIHICSNEDCLLVLGTEIYFESNEILGCHARACYISYIH